MNNPCKECGKLCEFPYRNKKYKFVSLENKYWHIAQKYKDVNEKPKCCDICNREDDEIKFVIEPFCAEIMNSDFEIWMCDGCYENKKGDI